MEVTWLSTEEDRYNKIIKLEDEIYEILDKLRIIKEIKKDMGPDHP